MKDLISPYIPVHWKSILAFHVAVFKIVPRLHATDSRSFLVCGKTTGKKRRKEKYFFIFRIDQHEKESELTSLSI